MPVTNIPPPDKTLAELRDAVERLVELHTPVLRLPTNMVPVTPGTTEEWSAPSRAFPWGYAPRWRFTWYETAFVAELHTPWGELLHRQEIRITVDDVPKAPPAIPLGPVSS